MIVNQALSLHISDADLPDALPLQQDFNITKSVKDIDLLIEDIEIISKSTYLCPFTVPFINGATYKIHI